MEHNLKLNDDSLAFMRRAAAYAKFFAIASFVVTGLVFVNELFAATIIGLMRKSLHVVGLPTEFSETFRIVYLAILLLLTAICALPSIYMYCFANRMRRAIDNGDTLTLALAFRSLKRYFVYCCVVIMVWLLFILMLVVPLAMIAGALI